MQWPQDNSLEWWMPVPGMEFRYWASSLGRVWGPRGLKKTTLFTTRKGTWIQRRRVVNLGKSNVNYVHRLVALAFYGEPPEGKPQVCHNNGDSLDNRVENLRWGSNQDNQDDKVKHKKEKLNG